MIWILLTDRAELWFRWPGKLLYDGSMDSEHQVRTRFNHFPTCKCLTNFCLFCIIQVELFTGIAGTGKLLNILSHIDDLNMMMNEIQSKKPCFVFLECNKNIDL